MAKKNKELTIKQWRKGLMIMAENACTIPEGEKVGRWDRKTRVIIIYNVLCSLARLKGIPV